MAYTVAFTKQAAKTLQRIPETTVRSLRMKIDQVAEDPYASHPNITKLQNREGYRLRVGDWRVIYEVRQNELLVLVLKIGLRGEVYR